MEVMCRNHEDKDNKIIDDYMDKQLIHHIDEMAIAIEARDKVEEEIKWRVILGKEEMILRKENEKLKEKIKVLENNIRLLIDMEKEAREQFLELYEAIPKKYLSPPDVELYGAPEEWAVLSKGNRKLRV